MCDNKICRNSPEFPHSPKMYPPSTKGCAAKYFRKSARAEYALIQLASSLNLWPLSGIKMKTLCHRLTNILEMHRGPWQKTVEQRSLQLTPAVSRNSENHISFDIPYLFTICNEWRVSFFIYFRKSAATFAKCRYDFSYYLCIKFCNINFIEISWSLGNSYKICWKLTNFAKSGRGSQSSIKNSC